MANKNLSEMSFLDHLEELRWLLIRSTLAVIICAAIAFFFSDFIFDQIIFGPKNPDFITYHIFCDLSQKFGLSGDFCVTEIPIRIQSREMGGQFSAHMWTSITAGFIIGFPFILWEFWKFISPALYENEKKYARAFVIVASLLFFSGVLFGYFLIAPLSVNFLANYNVSKEIFNDIDLSSYISLLRSSTVASGLLFELPIIIYFLTKIGLVTPKFLREYRKYTLIIVLILSAIITPPDVLSQVIVAVPIMILYEISILISSVVVKGIESKNQELKKY
ncbi:twin-arginine translocase subunit TatC [Flavobacterium sp. NRK F10]|uniref:Sec-independent protein translocase protein TatC n=1 Tax=Flavobacterium sediminis TaxID=2201181 RepID=A0A2U8QSB3_9FLAO|nr:MULTISPECIES: twin-arginine translocase subunit TatC [Flavobacterium]AWM12999.1 twin-arginine translocase subunit TatC [Flavobacterium sediminis]MCO6174149.1 twin-arginine translocase subunit TatC [Flavobacterium sp. NRK F10]